MIEEATLPGDQRLFAALNRRHWGGRLPRYRVVRRDTPADGGRYVGYAWHEARVVFVERALSGDDLRATLLHEMAHVAVERCLDDHGCAPGWAPLDGDHGPRFVAELNRLLDAGEPCLRREVELYGSGEAEARAACSGRSPA